MKPGPGTLVYAEFVIVPLLMGIIAAWSWKDLGIKGRVWILLFCFNGLIEILLSAVLLGEGVRVTGNRLYSKYFCGDEKT